jgi:aminoglycoside 6'-N-acetyltransferase I
LDAPQIVRLTRADAEAWIAMRRHLYAMPEAEHRSETEAWLTRPDRLALGARTADGKWIGFIEVGTRDVAEGCDTSPVAYIEALWVDASARRRGIARRLVEAVIDWCGERGYLELASDVELENVVSQWAHERLGFEETERLVTYRMDLRKR